MALAFCSTEGQLPISSGVEKALAGDRELAHPDKAARPNGNIVRSRLA